MFETGNNRAMYDFEFTGLHQNTTPISLGVYYSNGCKLYAEFTDYDITQVNDWLQTNVIDKLILNEMEENSYRFDNDMTIKYIRGTRDFIARELHFWHEYIFTDCYDKQIEMWGDCDTYDWMLLNALYGQDENGMPNLPKNIYYIPFDICTLMKIKGVDPDISREKFAWGTLAYMSHKHNSGFDASTIAACYDKLITM